MRAHSFRIASLLDACPTHCFILGLWICFCVIHQGAIGLVQKGHHLTLHHPRSPSSDSSSPDFDIGFFLVVILLVVLSCFMLSSNKSFWLPNLFKNEWYLCALWLLLSVWLIIRLWKKNPCTPTHWIIFFCNNIDPNLNWSPTKNCQCMSLHFRLESFSSIEGSWVILHSCHINRALCLW